MKAVTYKLNTILAALVGVICLAFVLIRTFMPQAILPLVDIPNLAAVCAAALVVDCYFDLKSVPKRDWALTAVLASGGQGLAYALCLPGGDVRPVCKALNEAFGGRGGGKPGFCQGSLACTDFADVQNFLVNYHE